MHLVVFWIAPLVLQDHRRGYVCLSCHIKRLYDMVSNRCVFGTRLHTTKRFHSSIFYAS